MLINLLLINLIVVFVIDISGFFHSVLQAVWHYTFKHKPFPDNLEWKNISFFLHPLDCSLCTTLWLSIIYIFTALQVGLIWGIFLASMNAFVTPITKDILLRVRDILTKIINLVYWVLKLDR